MQIKNKSHYRTYTMRFMKKGIYESTNYRSLFSRLDQKEKFRCGSILEIIKYCEQQRKNKSKSQTKQLLTISHSPQATKNPNQTIEIKKTTPFQILNYESPAKYEIKNKFRIKQSPKADNTKKEERKRQFQKIMKDLNTKTMEIMNRSNNFPKSNCQQKKDKSNANTTSYNFYHFRNIKNTRQELGKKQREQTLQIDYTICPW